MDIRAFRNIVFDFDGVIADSNVIKEENIRRSAETFCDQEKLDKFLEYFVGNNGTPREGKVLKFFDEKTSAAILDRYSKLNVETLNETDMVNGFMNFLDIVIELDCTRYVISGGDQSEVEAVLKYWNIADKFDGIYGGPRTKEEHVSSLNLEGKTMFIGDSQKDFEVAQEFGMDFIFMYGYTQFKNWKNFFEDKHSVHITRDFETLLHQ